MYKLIIIWTNGDKEEYGYHSGKEAEKNRAEFCVEFGPNIAFSYIIGPNVWTPCQQSICV